ncbi:APC family permease [Paraburkholderia silviterrae]|uniref:APC family permease n=1 Tax=Paraburkholderia silviterrae TaxID=2528715 RepID=A0A4R5M482_9BURK|nr:APC family permease [Paraburkholderia silviterrae]TDG20581.1 APC family permease [Paraburkholderia silviterrae]
MENELSNQPAVSAIDAVETIAHAGHVLKERLSTGHVVGLAMADVSPTMAVMLLSAAVFTAGGTFAAGVNIIMMGIVVLIALCLAELASMFPSAGGMYTLVKEVLPAPVCWITKFNYLLQGVIIPASIGLGIAQFARDLWPGLPVPDTVIACASLALAAYVGTTRVEIGAWLTVVMVFVELTVLGIVTVAGFTHVHQSLRDIVFHPVTLNAASNGTVAVGMVAMFATLAPAFNVINGYDASLGFAEELKGGRKNIGKAVVLSAVIASITIIIPLLAAIVAAPDLVAFLKAPSPVLYSVESVMGPWAKYIVDFGVIIALFNGALSLMMYFGRATYATGRDQAWPASVNRCIGTLNRHAVPAGAVVALALPACVLCFFSHLDWLLNFSGTMTAAVYFCVGIAALHARKSHVHVERPFRMKLWPIPPVVVIGFTGFALYSQESQYLVGEGVMIAAGIACWLLSARWKRSMA